MAGYIRQSSFVDGDTITAAIFNNEYNQLLNAFNNATGHAHDGTAAEGPVIGLIGDAGETSPNNKVLIDTTNNYIEFYVEVSSAPVQQLYIADGAIVPVTDSDVDLGTSSLYFKDTYTDTVTTTGNVTVGGNLTVTGNATISGNLTFGDADTDSINLAAEIDSDIIPNTDGTYDLGSATKEWQDLYIDGTANIDSLVADTADINGGTIDGSTIATSDITVGAGKTLDVSSGTLTLADDQISGDKVEGGTIAATTITSLTATSADINGGTIDGTTIATSDITVGAAKTLDVSAGTLTLADNQISGDKVEGGTIAATTITDLTFGSLNDGTITVTAFVDEDTMVSNSATLVPTQQSVKAYVDSQVTAQDLDFQGDTGGALSIDLDSETLTIAGGAGIDTSGATNTLTVAIDSTVATLTGTQTLTNKTLTTPVISSISNTGTLTLPTSTDTLVGRATTDTLTNKTLTSPVINTGVSGTAVLDDDTFATATATTLATSESIKAYVDTTVAATNEVVEDTTPQLGGDLDLNSSDITGTGNINITGTIQSSGNITGTLATAAQPNITSLGTLTGLTTTGDINFGDNDKAVFGAGSDLQIYHNGSDSFIRDVGTGNLKINADQLWITNAANTELKASFNSDGAVNLYYDASSKLATTATGIDVTGTATMDGLTVDGNISSTQGGTAALPKFTLSGSTTTGLYTPASNSLAVTTAGVRRATFKDNGDIEAYEDTGTTAKLFWDASAESLGIGTTSPTFGAISTGIEVEGTTAGIRLQGATTGALEVYHNNGLSTIDSRAATGGSKLAFNTEGSERLRIDSSGLVGIGTSSPSQKLTVSTTSASQAILISTTSANSDSGIGFTNDARSWSLANRGGLSDSLVIRDVTAGADRVVVDSSGNVGVGTTSPSYPLEVQSGGAGTVLRAGTSFISIDPTGSASAPSLIFNGDANTGLYRPASDTLAVSTGGGERLRIDSSGKVGIGTSSPTDKVTVNGAVVATSAGSSFSSGASRALLDWNTGASQARVGAINGTGTANSLGFYVGTTEKMRIDSSGNLLVGKTAFDSGIEGFMLDNRLFQTTDGLTTAYFNRLTSDGSIVEFRKDGTTVGSIGTIGGEIYIQSDDVGLQFDASGNDIVPYGGGFKDAVIDLGSSTNRFKDLYLSGGVYLGGTAAANQLDDYEEGTYTAAITCGTSGTVTLNASTDTASYTKIGDLVSVQGLLIVSSVSSPVGYFTISLPFGPRSLTDRAGDSSGSIFVSGSSANVRDFCMFVSEVDGAFAYVFLGDNNARQSDSANALAAATQISFQISYKAA